MAHPLDPLLRPRSVAVIGASANPSKAGYRALRTLRDSGWNGSVYPVSPRGGEILGFRVLRSLEDLPGPVDLAVVCAPAAAAAARVRECGAAGIRTAVVLSSGARRSSGGGASGPDLLDAAREAGVRVLGPNACGFVSGHDGLDLIGAPGVRRGEMSFLVQSEDLARALLAGVAERPEGGVSFCIDRGDATDVGLPELLGFAAADPATRVIVVQADRPAGGRAMLAAAARAVRSTPVVWLQAGRSFPGEAPAARPGGGARAGVVPLLRAGLAQAGVIEIARTDELLHVAEALSTQPPAPAGTGIAIVTDGGGHGSLAADALAQAGAPLAPLGGTTRERLREQLGPAAAVGNPVDVSAGVEKDPAALSRTVGTVLGDSWVGAVLVVGLFGGSHLRFREGLRAAELAAAEDLAGLAAAAGKGLVLHSAYAHTRSAPLRALARAGVPVVGSVEAACRCAWALAERGRALALPGWLPEVAGSGPAEPPEPLRRPLEEARDALTAAEARWLLAEQGVVFGGGPEGEPPAAVRLCVHAWRDEHFGPVLGMASGHVGWATARSTPGYRVLPLDAGDVPALLAEAGVRAPLDGTGGPAAPLMEELTEATLAVARCVLHNPWVQEVALDPLLVTIDGVRAMGARARLQAAGAGVHGTWSPRP